MKGGFNFSHLALIIAVIAVMLFVGEKCRNNIPVDEQAVAEKIAAQLAQVDTIHSRELDAKNREIAKAYERVYNAELLANTALSQFDEYRETANQMKLELRRVKSLVQTGFEAQNSGLGSLEEGAITVDDLASLSEAQDSLEENLTLIQKYLLETDKNVFERPTGNDTITQYRVLEFEDGYLNFKGLVFDESSRAPYVNYSYEDTMTMAREKIGPNTYLITSRLNNPNARVRSQMTFTTEPEPQYRLKNVFGATAGAYSSYVFGDSLANAAAKIGLSNTLIGKKGAMLTLEGSYLWPFTEGGNTGGVYIGLDATIPLKTKKKQVTPKE